jgi:hypothetical protein
LNAHADQLILAIANFTLQTGLVWNEAIDQRLQDVQTAQAAGWSKREKNVVCPRYGVLE